MRFENLQKRIVSLEQRAIQALPPWPPKEGSFTHHLWDSLGRFGERRGFMEMYQERAANFWRDRK